MTLKLRCVTKKSSAGTGLFLLQRCTQNVLAKLHCAAKEARKILGLCNNESPWMKR